MSHRLVVVSNRVTSPADRRAGGLATAIREALRQHGGLWFGWSGEIIESHPQEPRVTKSGNVTYVTTSFNKADHDGYYLGFANSALWPLLHYRLGLVDYRHRAFERYNEVNASLARMLLPFLRPDDAIWVHDYHLIPFAAALRKLGVANRIGFFLHTPFPSADVLAALPHYDHLLQSLCFYDLVGFQTQREVQAFSSCISLVGGQVEPNGMFSAYGMHSRVAAFPIGIDSEIFAEMARDSLLQADAQRLRESMGTRSLIIGADRLDYSKGVPNRFEAVDSLLSDWPEHRRKFSYLQITPHSRGELEQYGVLRRNIEAAAGRINGKFAEFDWTPIRYVNKSSSRRTLAGFFRLARIGFVTPLRDGMNLVAKEFVAAQDVENPGVLVLSKFAGAAQELDTALQVNPLDVDEMARALHRGLTMSLQERRERWSAMDIALRKNTIVTWREEFLAALDRAKAT